jgi:hypothetical protein
MPYDQTRLSILARPLFGIRAAVAAAALALAACPGSAARSGLAEGDGALDAEVGVDVPRFASRLIGDPAPDRPAVAVEVLDAGRAPRTLLRYEPRPGSRQRVHSRVTGRSEVEVSGRRAYSQPGIDTEAWFELVIVADRGDHLDCEVRVDRAEMIDWERAAPGNLGQLRRSLDRLRGRTYRFSADRRGQVDAPLLDLPELEADRDLARSILVDAMHPEVVLPEVPIGPGARWRVETEERGQTMLTGRTVTELELIRVRGRRLELALARKLESPPQPLIAKATVLTGLSGVQSTSRGRAVVDLALLHPVEWESTTELKLEVAALSPDGLLPLRARGIATNSMRAW